MSLFQDVSSAPTHLKAGIFGFAGGGKTRTASEIALGLYQYTKTDKPVLMIDSEKGSQYVGHLFKERNIPFRAVHTRSFMTMMAAIDEAVKGGNILIIDSITHFWQELMKSYMKKQGINRLGLRHIGALKEEWSPFPTVYLNSPIHIIMCGRAGYEWGHEENDEGEKELQKTGTKMKVEGDLGYEPTLLIEMEQIREDKGKVGSEFINRAWVIKDKFDVIKGKSFDMPTFNDFLPHIKMLNIGGENVEIDVKTDSTPILADNRSVAHRLKERDILVEELWGELELRFNARTAQGKADGAKFLNDTFGSLSKTKIENLSNEKIKEGLDKLKQLPLLTTETKEK